MWHIFFLAVGVYPLFIVPSLPLILAESAASVYVPLLLLIPLLGMFFGFFLRHKPLKLLALMYAVEGPLLLLFGLLVFASPTTVMRPTFLGFLLGSGLLVLLWQLLDPYIDRRPEIPTAVWLMGTAVWLLPALLMSLVIYSYIVAFTVDVFFLEDGVFSNFLLLWQTWTSFDWLRVTLLVFIFIQMSLMGLVLLMTSVYSWYKAWARMRVRGGTIVATLITAVMTGAFLLSIEDPRTSPNSPNQTFAQHSNEQSSPYTPPPNRDHLITPAPYPQATPVNTYSYWEGIPSDIPGYITYHYADIDLQIDYPRGWRVYPNSNAIKGRLPIESSLNYDFISDDGDVHITFSTTDFPEDQPPSAGRNDSQTTQLGNTIGYHLATSNRRDNEGNHWVGETLVIIDEFHSRLLFVEYEVIAAKKDMFDSLYAPMLSSLTINSSASVAWEQTYEHTVSLGLAPTPTPAVIGYHLHMNPRLGFMLHIPHGWAQQTTPIYSVAVSSSAYLGEEYTSGLGKNALIYLFDLSHAEFEPFLHQTNSPEEALVAYVKAYFPQTTPQSEPIEVNVNGYKGMSVSVDAMNIQARSQGSLIGEEVIGEIVAIQDEAHHRWVFVVYQTTAYYSPVNDPLFTQMMSTLTFFEPLQATATPVPSNDD